MYVGEAKMQANGSIGGSDAIQRQPELPAEMNKLAAALEFVEHSLNELHKRLEGKVTRPASTATDDKQAAVGPSTGYGQEIHGYALRAHHLGLRVLDLLHRLEV